MGVSGTYSVRHEARCIATAPSSLDLIRFYVGTSSISESNRIFLLEYSPQSSSNALREITSLDHREEIIALAASPDTKQPRELLITLGGLSSKVELFYVESTALIPITSYTLPSSGKAKFIDWPTPHTLLASTSTTVQLLHVTESTLKATTRWTSNDIATARADPRDSQERIAIATPENIKLLDQRIDPNAHTTILPALRTLDLDFNPNRRNVLASGGENGQVQIWDVRRPIEPLSRYYSHSHWVRSVRYNPLHDDLILSGGTDGVVHLWRSTHTNDNEKTPEVVFRSVCAFPEHDDSVYSVSWSASDEFAFASVSYDGRVAANIVPTDLKNDILLS